MLKLSTEIIYYGSDNKLRGRTGVVLSRFGNNKWRIRLEDGHEIFAGEDELQELVQIFDFDGKRVESHTH